MGSAAFTAFLFALSAMTGARAVRLFGSFNANLGRMAIALLLLATWAFIVGKGFAGSGLGWFLVSGAIGFGLGDIALFGALPRIGPRLTILLTQCLAGPVAGLAEWLWLDQKINASEASKCAFILVGVAAALLPGKDVVNRRHFWTGVGFGLLSAVGQGLGAVISRKATFLNLVASTPIDGGTAAFQRMVGGFAVTYLLFWLVRRRQPREPATSHFWARPWPAGWYYIPINGLVGPSIGVGFFQYALSTTPSAIVLAIVATSPVIVILFQYFLKEEKPGWISIGGALAAVGGAIALAMGNR